MHELLFYFERALLSDLLASTEDRRRCSTQVNAHKERLPRGEDNSLEGRQDFKRKSNAGTHWLNVGA